MVDKITYQELEDFLLKAVSALELCRRSSEAYSNPDIFYPAWNMGYELHKRYQVEKMEK